VFKKIAIFGVGLIGGSFALALKRAHAVTHVTGVGRSMASLQRAQELGIIDSIAADVAEAVNGADLVLIAAPVAQTEAILTSIKPHLQPGTVVTDAGSTKADVVAAARKALGEKIAQFVPAHPIAGPMRRFPISTSARRRSSRACRKTHRLMSSALLLHGSSAARSSIISRRKIMTACSPP
jgi:prephenate dehydrogenase